MSDQTIEGIIIRKQAIFEHDALLSVFSKEKGLIKILAKHAYTKRFRFGGYLDNSLRLSIQITKGRSFFYLKNLSIIEQYPEIRSSYNTIMLTQFFTKILINILEFEQENPELYDLLCHSLEHLNNHMPLSFIQDYFQDNLLRIEGLQGDNQSFKSTIESYTGKRLEAPRYMGLSVESKQPV